ncbi:hypothetical protein [Nitrososphaera viennensis]|uniref:Uncharacterized protein n=2 Tax=Nitrososphaera viennensis TaxID=1034015 RepID=A0A060HMW7_9ARCH|nr:hypothetical protein [Nitrososphaera viennensis]AIC14547.1 hypothetical protein NVIE_003550 [Nitrososphaera viennensis EN76]UVS69518.1 hypothetical protein NWT39_01730 [Nitrososphaera viennensis]
MMAAATPDEPKFKEVYCADCKMVLARYSVKYFTDADINELVHVHYSAHIKEGHAIEIRMSV